MKKYLVIAFYILMLVNVSKSQDVQESISDPKVIRTETGVLIYGLDKSGLKVFMYDENLKLKGELFQSVNKGSRTIFQVKPYGKGYRFELNFCELIVDENCEKISYREWTRDDRKAQRAGSNVKGDYVPNHTISATLGHERAIYVGETFLEFAIEESIGGPMGGVSAGGGADYKGGPIIRAFHLNEGRSSPTYKLDWQVEIENENISDYQWLNMGDSNVYLFVSGSEFFSIYKIDLSKEDIAYRYNAKLDDTKDIGFSDLFVDEMGNVLIAGNWKEKNKSKKAEQKGMDGWYLIKLNSDGKEVQSETYTFEKYYPKNEKGKLMKDSDLETRCLRLKFVDVQDGSGIKLIGENIRVYYASSSSMGYNGTSYTSTTSSGNLWQTYGFSEFSLNDNLSLVEKKYTEELGDHNNLVQNVYGQNIYSLIKGYDLPIGGPGLNFLMTDCIYSKGVVRVMFSIVGDKVGQSKFYSKEVSSSSKRILIGTYQNKNPKYNPIVFYVSQKEVLEFVPSKDEFRIKRREY